MFSGGIKKEHWSEIKQNKFGPNFADQYSWNLSELDLDLRSDLDPWKMLNISIKYRSKL